MTRLGMDRAPTCSQLVTLAMRAWLSVRHVRPSLCVPTGVCRDVRRAGRDAVQQHRTGGCHPAGAHALPTGSIPAEPHTYTMPACMLAGTVPQAPGIDHAHVVTHSPPPLTCCVPAQTWRWPAGGAAAQRTHYCVQAMPDLQDVCCTVLGFCCCRTTPWVP